MLKRTITAVSMLTFIFGFVVLSYFYGNVFMDLIILAFGSLALFEMYHCFKKSGYNVMKAPLIILGLSLYPTFYLLEHYKGIGLQGLILAIVFSAAVALTIFTFGKVKDTNVENKALVNLSASLDGESGKLATDDKATDGVSASVDHSLTDGALTDNSSADGTLTDATNEIAIVANSTVETPKAGDSSQSDLKLTNINGTSKTVLNAENNGSNSNKSEAVSSSADYSLKDLLATVFIMVYPYLFLSIAFILTNEYCGIFSILFAMLLPVASDTLAYWVGSTVKGKKLCPSISPNKTISGAIGGLFGGIIISIAFFLFFEYFNVLPNIGYVPFTDTAWKSALIYIAIGAIGGAVSEVGDIAASRIKRKLGIKDYGHIFPGHGGAMDRLDSAVFTLILLLLAFVIIY